MLCCLCVHDEGRLLQPCCTRLNRMVTWSNNSLATGPSGNQEARLNLIRKLPWMKNCFKLPQCCLASCFSRFCFSENFVPDRWRHPSWRWLYVLRIVNLKFNFLLPQRVFPWAIWTNLIYELVEVDHMTQNEVSRDVNHLRKVQFEWLSGLTSISD